MNMKFSWFDFLSNLLCRWHWLKLSGFGPAEAAKEYPLWPKAFLKNKTFLSVFFFLMFDKICPPLLVSSIKRSSPYSTVSGQSMMSGRTVASYNTCGVKFHHHGLFHFLFWGKSAYKWDDGMHREGKHEHRKMKQMCCLFDHFGCQECFLGV